MTKPTYTKDDPIWYGIVCLDDVRIYKSRQSDYRFERIIQDVPFDVAQKAVEQYLEQRYPGDWYETDMFQGGYYDIHSKAPDANPGRVWPSEKVLSLQRAYDDRLEERAEEMYTLLQEVAPDDSRVLAIVKYVETLE